MTSPPFGLSVMHVGKELIGYKLLWHDASYAQRVRACAHFESKKWNEWNTQAISDLLAKLLLIKLLSYKIFSYETIWILL